MENIHHAGKGKTNWNIVLGFPREFYKDDKYEQSVTSSENHGKRMDFDMGACLSKCGPGKSGISITKELIRARDSVPTPSLLSYNLYFFFQNPQVNYMNTIA